MAVWTPIDVGGPMPLAIDSGYTLGILLSIAFPGLDELFHVDNDGQSALFGGHRLTFHVSAPDECQRLLDGAYPMHCVPSWNGALDLPVMLEPGQKFAELHGREIHVNADIVTLPFFLLSRLEDALCCERDRFGRFTYERSLAKKYGFIDYPIVDEYAMLLRKEVCSFIPGLSVKPRPSAVVPTHDVDFAYIFKSLVLSARAVGHDLLREKNPLMALKTGIGYVTALFGFSDV